MKKEQGNQVLRMLASWFVAARARATQTVPNSGTFPIETQESGLRVDLKIKETRFPRRCLRLHVQLPPQPRKQIVEFSASWSFLTRQWRFFGQPNFADISNWRLSSPSTQSRQIQPHAAGHHYSLCSNRIHMWLPHYDQPANCEAARACLDRIISSRELQAFGGTFKHGINLLF